MHKILKRVFTGFFLSLLFILIFFFFPPYLLSWGLLAALSEILIVELPRLIDTRRWYFWVIILIYPILPFVLLIKLNQDPNYRLLILLLIMIVALHDTGSYIAGKLFGRYKIVPSISPAKTWEGFVGGYAITCLMVALLKWYWNISTTFFILSITILLICIISFLGDLFESFLKRRAHVKDSANILPGHGGLLDRLDGVLVVTYFFYFFRDFFARIFHI